MHAQWHKNISQHMWTVTCISHFRHAHEYDLILSYAVPRFLPRDGSRSRTRSMAGNATDHGTSAAAAAASQSPDEGCINTSLACLALLRLCVLLSRSHPRLRLSDDLQSSMMMPLES